MAAPETDAALPDLRLDGRAVWITGASRGLGRVLAGAFAAAGAELLLSARDVAGLDALADEITAAGGRAVICPGAVDDPAFAPRAAAQAQSTWGRLDGLVNNAGISPAFDPLARLDPAELERILAVNLTGALRCCQAAHRLLTRSERGASVVNVSSIHGHRAHERVGGYSASKAALEMVSRTLALEWAPEHIRVNCLAPGYVATDMTAGLQASERQHAALRARIPMGRFADPPEIVGAALFLAGDASRYMTGSTLTIDGGWSAR